MSATEPLRALNPTTPATIPALFERFVQTGRYLRNWTPKTERSYRQAFRALDARLPHPKLATLLTKPLLEDWVVSMRDRGMAVGGCNAYIRAVNSFSSWLLAEDEIPRSLRVKPLRAPQRVIETFSDQQISALTNFRPCTLVQRRLWTLLQTLLDTGCRIEEVLTVPAAAVDFDNMLLTVMGKGRRERKVPFGTALRRVLFHYVKAKEKAGQRSPFLFSSRSGARLTYWNTYRDIRNFCGALAIVGPRIAPHTFRHTFATNYLRQGGDIVRLSMVLGHTQITTTQRYLHLLTEDLSASHQKVSILNRLG
jgi:integrase/recombinase XerD